MNRQVVKTLKRILKYLTKHSPIFLGKKVIYKIDRYFLITNVKLKQLLNNTYSIPYLDYYRMNAYFINSYQKNLIRLLQCRTDDDILSLICEFENNFAEFVGAKYALATDSGTSALVLGLYSVGLRSSDKVIIPAITYPATVLAVIYLDAIPVLIDVKDDALLDENILEDTIKKNRSVRAIIPVHLYGASCELEKIKKIADKYNVFIVEDASQAHGTFYKGKHVGSWGNVGCFSLHTSKLISGIGNGGIMVTNEYKLYKKAKQCQIPEYDDVGLCSTRRSPAEINPFNAICSLMKLKVIDMMVKRREIIAKIYDYFLKDIPQVKILPVLPHTRHSYRNYTILAEKRDELIYFLESKLIQTKVFYPKPIYKLNIFKKYSSVGSAYPIAERISNLLISLPNGPYLNWEEILFIANSVREFYGFAPKEGPGKLKEEYDSVYIKNC